MTEEQYDFLETHIYDGFLPSVMPSGGMPMLRWQKKRMRLLFGFARQFFGSYQFQSLFVSRKRAVEKIEEENLSDESEYGVNDAVRSNLSDEDWEDIFNEDEEDDEDDSGEETKLSLYDIVQKYEDAILEMEEIILIRVCLEFPKRYSKGDRAWLESHVYNRIEDRDKTFSVRAIKRWGALLRYEDPGKKRLVNEAVRRLIIESELMKKDKKAKPFDVKKLLADIARFERRILRTRIHTRSK